MPVSPTSWMPLPFASLKTKPQTVPPDWQTVCADAGATATEASGSSAAASAARPDVLQRPLQQLLRLFP